MRIGYRYYPCVKASMISQIVTDNDGNFTCRKFNPSLTEAPLDFEIVKESNWEKKCCFKFLFCMPNFLTLCRDTWECCECCNNKY